RTTKDGMVGSSKPHHLKSEYLLAEVSCRAEADRQIDLAEGLDSLPRRNAMEWRLAGVKFVQSDPHELQGVGVHDVEAAASVHEHLGEAGVADEGIDNERIPSRMRDVVGVVLAAKGNGVLRPVEVGWHGFGDGENFPVLALALPRSHVRRCSSKDEEGVLHWGELVVSTFVASVLLLVFVAMRDAVVVLLEHLALLEGMIDRALVVRARLLKHVVELATTASRGASRSSAVWGGREGLLGVLCLPRAVLIRWDRLLSLPPPLRFLGGGVGLGAAAFCGRIVLALARFVVEDGTNCLLAGGVVGGSVEQLIGANGSASRKLVHQVPARRTLEESVDDFDMGAAGELGALLGEASHVVTQGLAGLLTTPSEVPGVPRAHVRALEIAHEDMDQVGPAVDLIRRQVLEPRSCGVSKMKRKVADDDRILRRAAQLAR